MTLPALLFDLDGTLTDSGEGVINCVQLALRHFGLPAEDRIALRAFVGPPLRESFPRFGVRPENVEEAVAIYRSRYNPIGIFENTVYPGIAELLEHLKAAGYRLYVGTSKPENMAERVLDNFGLTGYFTRICGANLEGTRDTKDEVLRYLLEKLPAGQPALMIGDTIYDVEGANAVGIPTVGVTWGYGSREEMEDAGAVAMADTPAELERLLLCDEFVKKIPGVSL